MKKIVYWLFMLPLFALLNGCDDTDTIIFDDELPQFEIKANAILLEVIMPKFAVLKSLAEPDTDPSA